MSKEDILLFEKMCKVQLEGAIVRGDAYKKHGLEWIECLKLSEIGLLTQGLNSKYRSLIGFKTQRRILMSADNKWLLELDEYIRQGEPEQKEKSEAWEVAIGLQEVDGLQTSEYLLETAKDHIEGKISMDEVERRIASYYEEQRERNELDADGHEADTVSSRIAKILGEKSFKFSSAEWLNIHKRLFDGVFKYAGKIRDYNISKHEWILKGKSVIYASCTGIHETMDYDFNTEKQFQYEGLSIEEVVKHLAKFTSDIWQIHPFCEGNTRATAIFMIKYVNTLGFKVNNDMFKKHSWYFRNALVRANYSNIQAGIYSTNKFLEQFFSNLLMGTDYELKNRYLHLDYKKDEIQTAKKEALNGKICLKELPLEEKAILEVIIENPEITQKEIASKIGKSERTVRNKITNLKDKGILERVNGKKNGRWGVRKEV